MLSYLFGIIRFHGLKMIYKFRKFMLSRRAKVVDSVSSERRNAVSALGMNHHGEHPIKYKTLDTAAIPKFVNQLVKPPVYKPFIIYNKVNTNGQICLEEQHLFDGHPDAWFTAGGKKGPAYVSSLYYYPNRQEPTTLWYHDHALGIARLNVYAGLAGFYLIREGDTCCREKFNLPEGSYEIPIVIQDRSSPEDGSLFFPTEGDNPEIHPYWVPEFFGDTIMVNGKVWPNLNVERRQYRFRVLNGSNARFYRLKLSNGMHFVQIGTDGGYLNEPVELSSLLLAPAERTKVVCSIIVAFCCRLHRRMDYCKSTHGYPSHPIHMHLVQFQILNRQNFNMEEYQFKWEGLNGIPPLDHPTKVLPVQPYLTGPPIPPDLNERGWKDTVRMNPNQVTRILVRFAPQDAPVGAIFPGENLYPFNPSVGPGYVWHCHIIDHEDNDMMRPYEVIS